METLQLLPIMMLQMQAEFILDSHESIPMVQEPSFWAIWDFQMELLYHAIFRLDLTM